MPVLNRDQAHARSAFQQVSQHRESDRAYRKKYVSQAHELPMLIRSAGLLQAVDFLTTRKEEAVRALLEDIALTSIGATKERLSELSRSAGLLEYLYLTREVLAVCKWYRNYAEAVLEPKTGTNSQDAGEGASEATSEAAPSEPGDGAEPEGDEHATL